MVFDILSGYSSKKILDQAIGKIKEHFDKKDVVRSINDFRTRHKRDVFDSLSHESVYDWEGLQQYVDENLFKSIPLRFLLPNHAAREQAKKEIYSLAYQAASAKTAAKQRRVDHCLKTIFEIVKNALLQRFDETDFLPSNMVADELLPAIKDIDDHLKELSKAIENKLDEVIKAVHYKDSFAQKIDKLKLPALSKTPFHYRNESIYIHGREHENSLLDRFLDDKRGFSFAAVTGPAGSGKSKLLYEYAKEMQDNAEWKVVFLQESNAIQRMAACACWDYPAHLLIVIDYAGQHSAELGKWLAALCSQTLENKLRILLLEREGMTQQQRQTGEAEEKALSYDRVSYPLWYDRLMSEVSSGDNIHSALYPFSEKEPLLELAPLRDEALVSIMNDYAKSKGKTVEKGQHEKIIVRCREIEKTDEHAGRIRPLVLLFVVDSYLESKGEYNRWNLAQLLNRLITRYEKHWLKTLCDGNRSLCHSLQMLLVYSTATGGWDTRKKLPAPLKNAYGTMRNSFNAKELSTVFASLNEKSVWNEYLDPLQPDLVGEFYVLHFLQHIHEPERSEMISAFSKNMGYWSFLIRCINDYANTTSFSEFFDDGMQALKANAFMKYHPMLYAILLIILSSTQDVKNAAKSIEEIKALYDRFPDSVDIVLLYAKGLVNLSYKQDATGAVKSIEALAALYNRFPDNADIILLYAKGLVNLSYEQDATGAVNSIDALKALYEHFPDNADIAFEYARGLFNISYEQDATGAVKSIDALKALSERFPDNADIALLYAKGLFNLSIEQDATGAVKSIETLSVLYNHFPDNADIAFAYAKGLFNLSSRQDAADVVKSIDALKTLYERFPDNVDIAFEYARGLTNLSFMQDAPDIAKSIETLKALYQRFPNNADIALRYARGLTNLSFMQDAPDIAKSIETLKALYERFPDNADIAFEYAQCLRSLGFSQYGLQQYGAAEEFFLNALHLGDITAGINLAYMIRRGEHIMHHTISVEELLKPSLEANEPFARMNELLYISTAHASANWTQADRQMAEMTKEDIAAILNWWHALYEKGDPEGLLVLLWLERHGLADYSLMRRAKTHYETLKKAYPAIPNWIVEKSFSRRNYR